MFFWLILPDMKRKATYQKGPKTVKRKTTSVVVAIAPTAVAGEMKYFDCDNSGTALFANTTTWVGGSLIDPLTTINLGAAAVATPLCLFAPTVGAALNQRIGRKVKVLKIKLNLCLLVAAQTAQGTADPGAIVRCMLVQDCQTNAAQMTSAQLMNDGTAATSTTLSYQNPNNFGRFRVLKEKRFVLEDPNMAGEVAANNVIQAGLKKMFKLTMNFKQPVEVHFNATNGGTVADIVDNSFHIVCGTDNVTGFGQTLAYYSRVCFKE